MDAIAAQDEMPDEVFVVDNNSTDDTLMIARDYSFVTILHEKTQGVAHARTLGFNKAKGDIIGRIDADTILPTNWVHTVKLLMTNQYYSAVNGPVFYYDMPFSPNNYWIDHQIRLRLYHGDRRAPFLFGSNSAVRKSAWKIVKDDLCHTRDVHEDLDLAIHLVQNGMHVLYDKRLLGGTSARRYDDSYKQFRHYMGMYLNSYRHHGINRISPRIATGLYWIGYVTMRWFRKGKTTARKNPMA